MKRKDFHVKKPSGSTLRPIKPPPAPKPKREQPKRQCTYCFRKISIGIRSRKLRAHIDLRFGLPCTASNTIGHLPL